jgi:hypothetical protein
MDNSLITVHIIITNFHYITSTSNVKYFYLCMLETLILGYSKSNFHTIFKEFRLNMSLGF